MPAYHQHISVYEVLDYVTRCYTLRKLLCLLPYANIAKNCKTLTFFNTFLQKTADSWQPFAISVAEKTREKSLAFIIQYTHNKKVLYYNGL